MCFRWIQLIIWFYFWQEKGVINAVRGFSSWFFLNSPHFHAVLGLPFKPQIGKIVVSIISYEVLGSTKKYLSFWFQTFVFLFFNSTEFSSMLKSWDIGTKSTLAFSTCISFVSDNVWCIKNQTKLSSVLLLWLVRFLMHQTLVGILQNISISVLLTAV